MNTIFINYENRISSDPHMERYKKVIQKIDLKYQL